MKRFLVPLALVLAAAPLAAQGYPPADGAVVTDLARVLSPAEVDSIQALLGNLRRVQNVDARVVTIRSFRDYGTRAGSVPEFATGLFNAWGIGGRPHNDGVLLLVAVDDREVKIELADGAPASLDARSQAVFEEWILPEFRRGNLGAGVVAGAEGIVRAYRDAMPGASVPAVSDAPAAPATGSGGQVSDVGPSPDDGGSDDGGGVGAGLLGLGALGAAGYGAVRLARRKRKCPGCGAVMERLGERADDVHLDSGQKLEEMLGSVDYHVYRCGACGNNEILPRRAWFSSKTNCPSCGYRTVQTYDHGGIQRVTQDCKHCGYHHEDTVNTPRLTRPAPSSSSGRRSSWGSGSSSSSSGSSGRSYTSSGSSGSSRRYTGGGSSSGRGGGGKW
jgi:uncharacterized protein